MGDGRRIGGEAGLQGGDVREPSGGVVGGEALGQLGLATAVVGEREQVDGDPAGLSFGQRGPQRLEGVPVGVAGEELVAVDEVEERHRLAAKRVDDVAVVHDLVVPAVREGPSARQRQEVRAADQDVEPVVVEAHAQPVADEARGHGVEHLAHPEAAGGGDAHAHLLVVAGAPVRQGLQDGPLAFDALGVAGVAAADELVDKGAVGGQVGEGGAGAQQERVGDRPLEVAVRALHRAVLVRDAGVVARRGHPVVDAQRLVASGQVLLGGLVEVAEGGREAVGAVLARGAAERPERVLQTFGERQEALAAQHDVGVLEARVGEPEVVEPVVEELAGHADAEVGRVGEVREPHPTRLVGLAEDDVLVRAVDRAPRADAPLERAADAGAEGGMASQDLLEDRDRSQARGRLEQRHDLGVEEVAQGIRPTPAAHALLHGGQARVAGKAVAGGGAEGRLGGGNRDGVGATVVHEEPHLAVGHMAAGHAGGPLWRDDPFRTTGRPR